MSNQYQEVSAADAVSGGQGEKASWENPSFAVWEDPSFRRIGANEAETGILSGPEILILLS